MRTESRTLRRRLLLAGLFLLALALRLGYQAQMSASPLWDHPILDEEYNDAWARRVAAGEGPGDLPFFRAPLYPWWMAAVYTALGEAPGRVRLAQALLSSLACLLVWQIGRRAFGPLAGWSAGLLAALYWPWVYFDAELQDVPLALFLNLAALAVLTQWDPSGRGGRGAALAAGLLLGLSAITRPTVLAVVPALALWAAWPSRQAGWRQRAPAVMLLLGGVAVAVLPVTALNTWGGGDRVLVASQGGVNFYLGNHPGSDGRTARLPGAPADWWSLVEASQHRAEAAAGRALRPSEVSAYWYRRGLGYWAAAPLSAAALTGRKAGYLASAPELPNNKQIRFVIERHGPILALPWPGFGVVAPLGLVGLLWGGGGRRGRLPAVFALAYGAAVVAFFVTARFRMPAAAVWILLAGAGIAALWRRARGPLRDLAPPAVALLLAALLVNLPSLGYEENRAHGHYTLGRAHRRAGDDARAEAEYRRALEVDPDHGETLLSLGALLLDTHRAAAAVSPLECAVGAAPDDVRGRANLALALERVGRRDDAARVLQDGLERTPRVPELWVRLGNLQAPAQAEISFRRALEIDPARHDARFNLGNVLLELGRSGAAAEAYEAVVVARPRHAGAWNMLGIARSRAGQQAPAVEAFARAVELEPSRARFHLNLGRAHLDAGDRAAAVRSLERAARLAPPDTPEARLAADLLNNL